MALNKHFKVKDTITVGQSGLFGNTVQIGTAGDYISADPAIDAWGPILSGGRDLSLFIGDGIDRVRETVVDGGTVTGDGVLSVGALAEIAGLNSVLGTPTETNGATVAYSSVPSSGDVITIPSLEQTITDGDLEAPYQGTFQIRSQTDGSSELKDGVWYSNGNYTTVEARGLQGYDSPLFTNLTLSGDGYADGSATLSAANTFYIDPKNDGDNLGTVVIKGNFQVDGTTTTINSTTLEVDDKTIVLNKGAIDDANGNGAGIVIDLGTSNATILYDSDPGEFDFNKSVNITGGLSASSFLDIGGATKLKDTLTVVGDKQTTLGGSLKVDGTLTDLNTNLEVSGTTLLSQTLSASGVATFGSAVSAGTTLHVDGESTLASAIIEDLTDTRIVLAGTGSAIEDSANLTFNGTQLAIGIDQFTVQQSTGNLFTDGNVDINGTTSLSGDFVISTDAEVEKLKITQATGDVVTSGTLSAKGVSIDGSVDVDGNTTLNTLSVSGNITSTGNTNTISGTVEIDGATTVNNTVTLSGAGTTASSVDYVYVGSAVATGEAASYTDTLPVANLNAAKFIVSVDNGSTGKSVIELLVAQKENGDLDGTAYGQVDVGTAQIVDIDIAASNSTVGITVSGEAGAAVTVFGTGYYN
jgi:hypothetical protein